MSLVQKFLDRLSKKKLNIAVVGDAMIDEYYSVIANRVSPEFPIPVLRMDEFEPTSVLPGGASNVCYQFRNFPCKSFLISEVDKKAKEIYFAHGLDIHSCSLTSGLVPRKKRFYQSDFPLCRLDIEDRNFSTRSEFLPRKLNADAIIFSDYHKGMLVDPSVRQKWMKMNSNSITIVDPKIDPRSWTGCTIFKPNEEEARKLSGTSNLEDQISFFRDLIEPKHIIITCGGDGIIGWNGDTQNIFRYKSKKKIHATSVIGAGDCFIAFLAMSYSSGFSIEESAEIAFKAGSCYVQNMHNRPISPYELTRYDDPIRAKYLKPDRNPDSRLIFTNGAFDILHVGHLKTLRYAKSLGDRLVVGINSDESIKRLKGSSRPILPLSQRMEMIAALDCVDHVISFDEDTPERLINEIQPDVVVKGGDYQKDQIVSGNCEEISTSSYLEGVSSTNIIEKIIKSDKAIDTE